MAKKKRIAIALAVAAALAAVAALCYLCTPAFRATGAATKRSLQASDLPVIKIGVDIKSPFVFIGSDGDYTGIDIDIAREACRRAGLTPKFVTIDWNERDNLLDKGDIDCLWCGYSWNSRTDRYRWSHIYLTTTISALIKKDAPAKTLVDLDSGATIAVRAGSVSEAKLLNGAMGTPADILVKAYGSVDLSTAALIKGHADCWMGYTYLADRILTQYPDTFRMLARDALTIDLGVAFDANYDGPYIDSLNDAIDAMSADGTSKKIEKRYIDSFLRKDGENDED